jgi:hypothetical protein
MLSGELEGVLFLLLGSDGAARARGDPVQEAALPWAELAAKRVTAEQIRELLALGYIECRGEDGLGRWGAEVRFALLPGRVGEVCALLASLPCGQAGGGGDRPRWLAEQRQLWYGGAKVAQLHRNAPRLEAILRAFEEAWWRSPIANPLACEPYEDPRALAVAAVKNLRRAVCPSLLTFFVREGGRLIHWKALA